jgi:hypothetical protein
MGDAVRQSRPAPVEGDQARERRQPLVELHDGRLLPVDFEVADSTVHEH